MRERFVRRRVLRAPICTEVSMPYLHCPDCGWTRSVERSQQIVEHCPRCLAGQRRTVELAVSAERPGPRWANAEANAKAAAPASAPSGEAAR
jgi:hypothetical protein